ncbi:glycoside hydrolase superfamily [Lipomyces kononenkoae]
MRPITPSFAIPLLLLTQLWQFSTPVSAYSSSSSDNVAVYWGQASAGSQQRLSYYCESNSVDIVILSFLMTFYAADGLPEVNFANACSDTFSGTTLLQCDQIAQDIQTCQSMGKKVLLSLGGAVGSYGFSSDSEASSFANTIWNMFGGGTSNYRPFRTTILDGFDLDIENGNNVGYAAFITQMRTLYSGGDYYISGAPQCPYPDAGLGDALDNAWFDFVFIQFYNNYCGVNNPSQFNYDSDWQSWVSSSAINKDVKLYVGVPGSPTAAGSGYSTPSSLSTIISGISDKSSLGGVMIWDASQAFTNTVGSSLFIDGIKSMLGQVGNAGSSSPATAASSAVTSVEATVVTSSGPEVSSESLVLPSSVYQGGQNLYVDSVPTSAPASDTSSASVSVEPSTSVAVAQTSSPVPTSSSLELLTSSAIEVPPSSSSASTTTIANTLTTSAAWSLSSTTTVTQSSTYTSTEYFYVTVTIYHDDTTSTFTSVSTIEQTTAPALSSSAASTVTTVAAVSTVSADSTVSTFSTVSTIPAESTVSTESTISTISTISTVTTVASATAQPSSSGGGATASSSPNSTSSNNSDCSNLTGVDLANCQNAYFATLSASSACTDGMIACVEGLFAKCDGTAWVTFSCPSGTVCTALPNGDATYAVVTCDTESDINRLFGTTSSKKIRRRSGIETEESGAQNIVRRSHRHHAHRRRATF